MNVNSTIWILDDNPGVLTSLDMLLRSEFNTVKLFSNPKQILSEVHKTSPDLLLMDMNYTSGAVDGREGLELLKRINALQVGFPVVVMTAYSEIELAVESMKLGAADFVHKPWTNERLRQTVRNVVEQRADRVELQQWKAREKAVQLPEFESNLGMVGSSPSINRVRSLIRKVANSDANVLILGENGTGKELVAQAIHQVSHRNERPFVKIDVGAIHKELFESELFGARKGAYTGITSDKKGRMFMANKGSLFLDEIGNLSIDLQAKLLSAIQNREITPLGDTRPIAIDVRLISATNLEVERLLDSDTFRQDLLYRINTVEIKLPPLRERKSDVGLLLEHFVSYYGNKYHQPLIKCSDDCVRGATEYHWPGNVRELQHAVERAVLMADGDRIELEDLVPGGRRISNEVGDTLNLADREEQLVREAMKKHQGNISRAANELGITRSALYRRLDKFGI